MIATRPKPMSEAQSKNRQTLLAPLPLNQSDKREEPIATLLNQLRALDIHLWLEEDRLRYNAPKGAMTPALVEQLRHQKEAIIAFLRRSAQTLRTELAAIPQAPRQQPLPLSFAQERLWLLDQLNTGKLGGGKLDGGQLDRGQSTAYNMPAALHLQGKLNRPALVAALDELVRRHEILRTSFPTVDGLPIQSIAEASHRELTVIDLQSEPLEVRNRRVKQAMQDEASYLFDLTTGPLLRTTLLQLATDEHLLLLTMHHIICDGWSINLMIGEISALYNAFCQQQPSPLPALPIQFGDFAHWQRQWLQGERLQEELTFWKEQLADAPPLLELPTHQPRLPIQRFRGARLHFKIDESLTKQLRSLSQQHGATLAMTLLSAFKILLARYSGQNDLVIGMPIANRNHAGIEQLIGFFLNTLLLRTNLSDNPTFSDLLVRVRHATLEAYSHQDLPFIKLAEALQPSRTLSYNPLFQVLFLFQGEGSKEITLPGLKVNALETGIVPLKDDLVLEIEETASGLQGNWDYDLDLFKPAFIEQFSAHFERLLRAIVADPQRQVLHLPMLSPLEQRQQLVDWNNTETYLDPNVTFLRRFEAQVAQTPHAVAVSYQAQRLSYAQLNARAEQIAAHLSAQGLQPETIVALLAPRSPDFLAAILAIFKSGGVYLPLDLRSPAQRIGQILQQSQAPIILASHEYAELLNEALATIPTEPTGQRPQTLFIENLETLETLSSLTETPIRNPSTSLRTNSQLAYILYTSGSTGTPKGAMVEQLGMINHLFAKIKDLKISERDVIAQNASQSFVVSVWQFLAALVVGGSVHILPDEIAGSPQQLLEACASRGVTILEVVPSFLRTLLDEISTIQDRHAVPPLPTLRWLVPTGELLQPGLARQWLLHYPNIPLLNAYGSTECADDVAHCPIFVAPGDNVTKLPIGRPVVNTRLYILDAQLQPVPIGVAGELYVGGVGVGRGYLHDPKRSEQAFLPDPFSNNPSARLYKTGDKVCYRPDGNIEYLGRIDFQVKIRGFRIELGEIEAVLSKHPAVAQAVVVALEDAQDNKQLVGYVIPRPNQVLQSDTLRQFLGEQLPNYMVPAAIVILPEMPLNNSGKVDRKALPSPNFGKSAGGNVAPRTPLESKLMAIWQSVLGLDEIGVENNFFDIGGHSLLATQVVSRIRQSLQVELPLRSFFETATISALAQRIAHLQPAAQRPPLTRIDRNGALPLSFAQQRLWFIDQLEGAGSGYVISAALRLHGKLDQTALHKSLEILVQRHESLRTTIVTIDDQPCQRILSLGSVDLPVIDLRHLPQEQRLSECQARVFADVQRPFSLAAGPLMRCTLYQLAEDEFVLGIAMHHIISDGWSIGVMSSEMLELYRQQINGQQINGQQINNNNPRLPELTIQVADYAQWQRSWLQGEGLQNQLDYWKMQLADAPALLELPTDRARTASPSFRSDSIPFALSAAQTHQLKTLAQAQGTTLYMCLLAAFATLLARHSGQDDLVIGSPIANRTLPEIEPLIGFFANTLALRIKLQDNPSFVELLQQVRQTTLDAYAHQDLPFEQVVDALNLPRNMSHTPLFQVMFAWQSANQSAQFQTLEGTISGLDVEVLPWAKPAVEFDLVLSLAESAPGVEGSGLEGNGIEGSWEFSSDLFERSTIERMLKHFQTLLNAIVDTPQQPALTLPIFGADELHALAISAEPTTDADFSHWTLHQLFEAQVAKTPHGVATICGEQRLTYTTLNRRANQLAHTLVRQGIGRGATVAICMERCPEMVVAVLGVIKAGAAYLPLDPAYPADRLQFMLTDANATALLTQKHLVTESSAVAPLLNSLASLPRIVLDTDWTQWIEEPTGNGAAAVAGAEPVYLIYTSGSTGNPKGVVVPHRGVVNTVQAMSRALELGEGDRFLQFAPFGFDVNAMQLFTTLTSGATLVFPPPAQQLSLAEILHLCAAESISVLDLPVALWQQSVSAMKAQGQHYPTTLRVCMTGGEKPAVETLRDWATLCEHEMTFLCSYGPTEASITTTIFVTNSEQVRNQPPQTIPLGSPLPNTALFILDTQQQPVPLGTIGELYIAGVGVAIGYLNQQPLTHERFVVVQPEKHHSILHLPGEGAKGGRRYRTGDLVRRTADGSLEFIGRVDSQVKVRGFRIELGEIEARLKEHPNVGEAVVTVLDLAANDKRIVAYYQTQHETLAPATLRDFLKSRLPSHMLPSAYVAIQNLPLTPNGKLDRKALPLPDLSLAGSYVAPRNESESQIAAIWCEVLGLDEVGVESNFFDLGGHSLLATQIVSRIRQQSGIDLPLRSLMEEPTVAGVAQAVAQIQQTLAMLRPDPNQAENVEVFEL